MRNWGMVRPREFDLQTALQGATDIFWRQGYRATNLPDLLGAMGLTRGSFYKAFRDKESVYLDALDFYDANVLSKGIARLDACEGPSAWACLAGLFDGPSDTQRGCFICNAMVELAPEYPNVAAKTDAMAARLRDAIAGVLERCGPARDARQIAETADLILHLYFGHQAMGKAGGVEADWAGRLRYLLGEAG